MSPQLLARGVLLALASLPAFAQSSFFAARTHEFRVNAATAYNQYWVRVDADPSGSTWAFSFSSGQDPYLRLFDLDAAPLTGTIVCTPTQSQGIQDEAEVCVDKLTGNVLVAWSERYGYDGEQMGIFGRLFAPSGAPLTNEFQINNTWQASQWRPLMASPPGGGFVVTFSGDWDADCYFRVLDSNGAFLSATDVPINTYINGGQADPAIAIAPDGTMFFPHVDYSAHAGVGTGTNLWGRTFDASGTPLQSQEFVLTTPAFSNADQREPRVAADGLGRFIVVWQDYGHDGAGWGIVARRFNTNGSPLGGEFVVNTTTAGSQLNPRVAADDEGNFIVVWDDASSGATDIRLQRFDANATPVGSELLVNETIAGSQMRPSIVLTPSGDDIAICWEGPGVQTDAYARLYATYQFPQVYCTAKINSLGCTPAISFSGKPTLSGPDTFSIRAAQVLNNKSGLLFWGSSPFAAPFGGGILCVHPPIVRTGVMSSGGNPPPDDCSGTYSFHFSQAYMQSQGLVAGDVVYAQIWSRDPSLTPPDDMGLTDAVVFEIRP